jgi:hypothetical protein
MRDTETFSLRTKSDLPADVDQIIGHVQVIPAGTCIAVAQWPFADTSRAAFGRKQPALRRKVPTVNRKPKRCRGPRSAAGLSDGGRGDKLVSVFLQ